MKAEDAELVAKIDHHLLTSDTAVERAIVAIFHRQTQDEQSSHCTKHSNGIGFSGVDASLGTYLAKWILSGKHLSGRFLVKGRGMAQKYRGQLLDIAKEKAKLADSEYAAHERSGIIAA